MGESFKFFRNVPAPFVLRRALASNQSRKRSSAFYYNTWCCQKH